MPRSFIVEAAWLTKAGLPACIVIPTDSNGRKSHRNGYVGIPQGHPLYEIKYNEETDKITVPDDTPVGKRSSIQIFVAACAGKIPKAPEYLFDCHGGLTYSDFGYFLPEEHQRAFWWFGFDCMHYQDAPIEPDPNYPRFDYGTSVVRSAHYVHEECENLAKQIVDQFPLTEPLVWITPQLT